LNELVDMLEDVLGKPVERRYLPGRPFDVPVSVLSNDLARDELEWAPSISMRDGIARAAEWMKRELEKLDT
jgi:UDP-glucose 4-epimerase